MVSLWFGDLLRPFDILYGQISLQVIYFLVIHRQSQSFRSLLPYSLLSLLLLRLWSFWSTQLVQPGCSTVFSLSRVCGNLCHFFPGCSFPRQGWAATMGYSSRLCPCPVSPSLPPGSLSVVQSGSNFRLVVSGGGLPYLHCQCAFGDGRGLHFRSLLSVSTFLVFAAVVSLRISGVLVSPTLPSVHLGFLWWMVSLHLSSLLRVGAEFRRSCSSQFPSGSFSIVSPFVPEGNFVTCFLFIFSLYISYLYRIAAAWLLHVRASAGWEPTVPAV